MEQHFECLICFDGAHRYPFGWAHVNIPHQPHKITGRCITCGARIEYWGKFRNDAERWAHVHVGRGRPHFARPVLSNAFIVKDVKAATDASA